MDLSQFPPLNTPTRILLGPGPSTADPRILRAMATPLLGHLDPAFLQLMDRIQDLLRFTFETQNPFTLAVPGTGMAAMETAVANLVEPGDTVLVCSSGFFSLRIAEIARRNGGQVSVLQRPWGEVFTAEEVQAALEQFLGGDSPHPPLPPAPRVAQKEDQLARNYLQELATQVEMMRRRVPCFWSPTRCSRRHGISEVQLTRGRLPLTCFDCNLLRGNLREVPGS